MQWQILRCSSKDTLVLEQSLINAGVRAWTPRWKLRRRLPRLRKVVTEIRPLLPTFVFVDPADVRFVEQNAGGDLPQCTVFRFNESRPIVDESELTDLRSFSEELMIGAKEPEPFKTLPVGTRVVCESRLFKGMEAVVIGQKIGENLIRIEKSSLEIFVPPFLLKAIGVSQS